jgi:hypothetical protein
VIWPGLLDSLLKGKELIRNKVLEKVLTKNFSHLVLKPYYLTLWGAMSLHQTLLWGFFPPTQNCILHPRITLDTGTFSIVVRKKTFPQLFSSPAQHMVGTKASTVTHLVCCIGVCK